MSQPGCARLLGTYGPGLKIQCFTLGAWNTLYGTKPGAPTPLFGSTHSNMGYSKPLLKDFWGSLCQMVSKVSRGKKIKSVKHRTPSKQALCAFDPQVKAMWGTLLKVDKLFTCIFKSNLNCARLQQKLEHRLHFAQM